MVKIVRIFKFWNVSDVHDSQEAHFGNSRLHVVMVQCWFHDVVQVMPLIAKELNGDTEIASEIKWWRNMARATISLWQSSQETQHGLPGLQTWGWFGDVLDSRWTQYEVCCQWDEMRLQVGKGQRLPDDGWWCSSELKFNDNYGRNNDEKVKS